MDWNTSKPTVTFPAECGLAQLFEMQVQRTPDAIALLSEEHHLTYAQLDDRAAHLASRLRQLGVGPDHLVGVCLPRSLDLLIAVFAILKAGGAYVPLDPTTPSQRLIFLLQEASLSLVLTHSSLLSLFSAANSSPNTHKVAFLCLDRLSPVTEAGSVELFTRSEVVSLQQAAYLISTSGSTGLPKGVLVSQHAVLSLLGALQQFIYTHVQQDRGMLRVSLNGSLSFDTSVKQLFQLLYGHTLVLIPELLRAQGKMLIEYLVHKGVEVFDCTPSQLDLLWSAGLLTEPMLARLTLLLGGEAIPPTLWTQLLQTKGIQAYNLYGPTECCVDSTGCLIQDVSGPHIGGPLANTQVYVLDEQMQPVPIGVAGELYVGGAGLARGYLRQAGLTAERFVPHPWSQQPGERLYRTGDRVRWHVDGHLEYLGRMDQQVKLRGYRIELAEIEAVLRQQSTVRDAVVLLREDTPKEKRLVAYLIPRSEDTFSIRELRFQLRTYLPEYMIPSSFVLLDAFPLSSNGKIDRPKLPVPDQISNYSDTYVMPRNLTEEKLVELWEDVLSVKPVGIFDNFFELGGHSISATQLLARIRDTFHKDLPLPVLFETPTLAELAPHLEYSSSGGGQSLETIQPRKPSEPVPLSSAQERIWFLHQLNPATFAYTYQCTIHFTGALHVEALQQSLNEVIRRHEIFRTTFEIVDERPMQIIHPEYTFSIPSVDLRNLSPALRDAEEQRLIGQEFRQPFDPGRLPLIRWTLLRRQAEEHTLIHVEHHFVHDGWSLN
ncbi:MAG TPA: amino acid adenylation domain-containing protein, partial [Ktedonobacteraceae bacterium]|nr:amino acid adenylation domain-containing protein [Ktedonobacteraceae bacterium]